MKRMQKVKFVVDILRKNKEKTVLELGCGTGLYLFPLSKKFEVEGLDISKEMLSIAKKKGSVNFYEQDMNKFKTGKKYDAILILNSGLALLPGHKAMIDTIKQCRKHLNHVGILLLDLPNHSVEIEEDNSQDYSRYHTKNGQLDVISRSYKKGNKWVEEWHGFMNNNGIYKSFNER